jgi:peptide/nickel transport system substrate-binding protein
VAFRGDAQWNAAHWKNDEFDSLLTKFEAEPELAARSRLGTRLAEILNEEVPTVITYFNDGLRPVRRNVRGVSGNMSNYLDLTSAWLA